MNQQKICMSFILVFCLLMSGFISVQGSGVGGASSSSPNDINPTEGISDRGIQYDKELIGQFLLNKWVHVTVDIKDTSNITIPNRNSPDFESRLQQRNKIMIEKTDAVLSTLSKDEFQLKMKSEFGGFFAGNITKEGFEKLLNDERVKKVYAKKEFQLLFGAIAKNLIIPLALIILLVVLIIILIKLKKRRWRIKKKF
jgi:hypothetical protein